MAPRAFWSYAHEDRRYLKAIKKEFAVMVRNGQIQFWDDGEIPAGGQWADQICAELEAADLVLLLVSASFLASYYCVEVELRQALARGVRIIPVILTECDWREDPLLAPLNALPQDGQALRGDRGWNRGRMMELVQGVRRALLHATSAAPPAPAGASAIPPGLPFLCDRDGQDSELRRAVSRHQQRLPGRPFVAIVHGDESEHLVGYQTRLCAFTLPLYLKLPRDTEVQHQLWLRWPDGGLRESRVGEHFRDSLGDSLNCAPDEIGEALQAMGRPVMVYTRLFSTEWGRRGAAFLDGYLGFWNTFRALKPPAAVIACTFIQYREPGRTLLWRTPDPTASIQGALTRVSRQLANGTYPHLSGIVLPELRPVPRTDAEGLAGKAVVQQYCRLADRMAEWHDDVERIYGTHDHLPMKTLEPHLRTILPKYASRS